MSLWAVAIAAVCASKSDSLADFASQPYFMYSSLSFVVYRVPFW
jgi:hypothetical protein